MIHQCMNCVNLNRYGGINHLKNLWNRAELSQKKVHLWAYHKPKWKTIQNHEAEVDDTQSHSICSLEFTDLHT